MSIDWELERMRRDMQEPFVVTVLYGTGIEGSNMTHSAHIALNMAEMKMRHVRYREVTISRNGLVLWRRPCRHDWRTSWSGTRCIHCGDLP